MLTPDSLSSSLITSLCLCVFVVSFIHPAHAKSSTVQPTYVQDGSASKSNKVEQEFTQLLWNECEAILSNNTFVLDQLWADKFIVISTEGRTVPRGQAQEYLRSVLPSRIEGLCQVKDVAVDKRGRKATVTGVVAINVIRLAQSSMSLHLRFTHSFVRRQGRWQAVSLQFFPPEPGAEARP